MRKIFIILLVLVCSLQSFTQDVIGSRVIAKQALFVRDNWVDSLRRDTLLWQNDFRTVPTSGAVYKFVLGHGGSSTGQRFGISGEYTANTSLGNFMFFNQRDGYFQWDSISTLMHATTNFSELEISNDFIDIYTQDGPGVNRLRTFNNTSSQRWQVYMQKESEAANDGNLPYMHMDRIDSSINLFSKRIRLDIRNESSGSLSFGNLQNVSDTSAYYILAINRTDSTVKQFSYWPGGGGNVVINEANLGQNYLIRYDTTTTQYETFNPDIMFGKMEFVARRSGWLSSGDSVLVDSNFLNVRIWGAVVNGYWLSQIPGTSYYESDSVTGQITFHPNPGDSSRITVFTSWIPMWTTLNRRAALAPVSWNDFDYNPADDLEELTSNQWTVKGAASLPYTAVSNGPLSIPSGQDGRQRIRFFSANGYDAIIGFDATTTNNSYGNYDYWAQCASDGTIYVNENSAASINTGIQCVNGDYLAIFRVGSTVTCQKSSDGINWTLVYTYSATTTGTLYAKADCSFMGAHILFNPQGYNLQ